MSSGPIVCSARGSVGVAAVEVRVQGVREMRKDDGAVRRREGQEVGVEFGRGAHVSRAPVSR
jgi:hypothetical protein